MKAVLVFIVLFLTMAINLPHGMISRIGFDANYLIAALAAVVLTGLLMHRQLFLIVLVVFACIAANMPDEMMKSWGLESNYFLAVLIALVVLPVGSKLASGK